MESNQSGHVVQHPELGDRHCRPRRQQRHDLLHPRSLVSGAEHAEVVAFERARPVIGALDLEVRVGVQAEAAVMPIAGRADE
jgi:hypothetical protein